MDLMRAHRLLSAVAIGMCVWALAFAFTGSVAFGAYAHPFVSSFGAFENVQGVAVEEGSGDVFVYDGNAGTISKFDSSGAPLEFASTKTNSIPVPQAGNGEAEIAVSSAGATKGDIYLAHASTSDVLVFNAEGKQAGELTEEAGKPWGEACGVAVDSSGNVYVGLYGEYVNKYTPSGTVVKDSDYAVSLSGTYGVCNIAADSAGNVYVDSLSSGPVTKYEALQFGLLPASGTQIDASGSTLAVDASSNEVYLDQRGQIVQYSSIGEQSGRFGFSGTGALNGGSLGIAVDGKTHDIYASDGAGHISIFGPGIVVPGVVTGSASDIVKTTATLNGTVNPSGVEVTSCEFEWATATEWEAEPGVYHKTLACSSAPGSGATPVAVSAELTGLTLGSVYHYRLAASNTNGTNEGLDTTFMAARLPTIGAESVTSVSFDNVSLQAEINPLGSDTTYYFQYGTADCAEQPEACATVVGPSGGDLGAAEVDQLGSVELQGLTPETTYHFRVVATNAQGTVDSAERTFTTQGAGTTFQLPDDRAYEMVSPVDKNSGDIVEPEGPGTKGGGYGVSAQASVDGDSIVYASLAAFADTQANPIVSNYLATRGPGGWSTHAIDPQQAPSSHAETLVAPAWLGFTPDLATGVFWSPDAVSETEAIPTQANLYVHNASSSWQLLSGAQSGAIYNEGPAWPKLGGLTPDGSHIIFSFTGRLTPEAVSGEHNLYEWGDGRFTLINRLPDGTVAPLDSEGLGGFGAGTIGGEEGFNAGSSPTDISNDGSRVFWSDCNPNCREGNPGPWLSRGKLFVSTTGEPSVQIDASQGGPESGGGVFWTASSNGSQAFFTDPRRLTKDSTVCGNETLCSDLYRFDTTTNQLTDITLDTTDPLGAQVQGVVGASEDGSYVYFVANGVLSNAVNSRGQSAVPGADNLYVYEPDPAHPGQSRIVFIARLNPTGDANDFTIRLNERTSQVTPDGKHLAFQSIESVTGYDNTGDPEVFEYDADANEVVCASCNPTGAEPIGPSLLPIGSPPPFASPRYLSKDGARLFFDSFDALVPQDSNGTMDVYEYENGRASLISPGDGPSDARFADASADASDVFFTTRQQLVPQDRDENVDLYDARENGVPEQISPPVCSGTGCQGVPSAPPIFATPSSVTFAGVGNFPVPAKEVVKAKKIVKAKKRHKPARRKKPGRRRNGKKTNLQIKRGAK